MTNSYSERSRPTIGTDFHARRIYLTDHETEIILQIWDTAGMEKFHGGTLGNSIYRGAHGAMIVYDCADSSSFTQVEAWKREALTRVEPDQFFPIVVIGNKVDLLGQENVLDSSFVHSDTAEGVNSDVFQSDPLWKESIIALNDTKHDQTAVGDRKIDAQGVLTNQSNENSDLVALPSVVTTDIEPIDPRTCISNLQGKEGFLVSKPTEPSSSVKTNIQTDIYDDTEDIKPLNLSEQSVNCGDDTENSCIISSEKHEFSSPNGFFGQRFSPTTSMNALDIISIVRILENMPDIDEDVERGEETDDMRTSDNEEVFIEETGQIDTLIQGSQYSTTNNYNIHCKEGLEVGHVEPTTEYQSIDDYTIVPVQQPPYDPTTIITNSLELSTNLPHTTEILSATSSAEKLNTSTFDVKLTLDDLSVWCIENDYIHIHTSAKTGIDVEKAILTLASLAYETMITKTWKDSIGVGVNSSIKISELYLPRKMKSNCC